MHPFTTSILIRSCQSAPLLLLGLGALFVLSTYCFVWPITKTLVNGACSQLLQKLKYRKGSVVFQLLRFLADIKNVIL